MVTVPSSRGHETVGLFLQHAARQIGSLAAAFAGLAFTGVEHADSG
jgi:hypothetical protein